MGNAAGQPAHRLHFLGLAQLGLQGMFFGNILDELDDRNDLPRRVADRGRNDAIIPRAPLMLGLDGGLVDLAVLQGLFDRAIVADLVAGRIVEDMKADGAFIEPDIGKPPAHGAIHLQHFHKNSACCLIFSSAC